MMKNKKRLIVYIFWGFFSTLLFLYALFPSSLLKRAVTDSLRNYSPEFKVTFKDIRPAFPPGLKLTGVNLFHQEKEFLKADYLKLTPGLFSLISDRKKIRVTASSLGGMFQTSLSYKERPGGPDLFVKTDIESIQLEKLPLEELIPGGGLKGLLDLKGEWDISGQKVKKGEVEILLKAATVAIKSPIPDINALSFDTIQVIGEITNNRMEIKKGDVAGKEADGSVTGFIDLKIPLETSALDLKGTVKPRQEFLKSIGKKFPVGILLGKVAQKSGVPFTVRGTIQEPEFSMER